jgi:eight-cysteine-cluster-containing protein
MGKNIVIMLFLGLFLFGCESGEVIDSFSKCVDAGYDVMESYPRQCNVPDGETFVEVIEKGTECTLDSDCVTGGCSGTICQSRDSEPMITTCEWSPSYACYKEINCGCINGKCSWDRTEEFELCYAEAGKEPVVVIV